MLKIRVKIRSEQKSQKSAKKYDFRPYRRVPDGICNVLYQGSSFVWVLRLTRWGETVGLETPRALFTLRVSRRGRLKAMGKEFVVKIGLNNEKTEVKTFSINKQESEEGVKAKNHLETLLKIFVQGLCKPLPLFLNSSPNYIKHISGKKPLSQEDALKRASEKWEKPYDSYEYDLNEDANFICFGETPPPLNDQLNEQFAELAEAIYGPISSEVQ